MKAIMLWKMGAFARKRSLKVRAVDCNSIGAAPRQGRTYSTVNLNFSRKGTIVRDVSIIGGGTTGTFSAIRLRDQGKSVAVIEQKDRLGGHTITYQDPVTGLRTEAGVVVIRNSTIAHQIFRQLNIPLVKFKPSLPDSTLFVDFTTGKQVNFY
jgi:hypothetical protein